MTTLRAFLLTSAAAAFLSGCQTTASPCDGWKPIRPTTGDVTAVSDQLATAIVQHNAFGARVCGWRAR